MNATVTLYVRILAGAIFIKKQLLRKLGLFHDVDNKGFLIRLAGNNMAANINREKDKCNPQTNLNWLSAIHTARISYSAYIAKHSEA